MKLALTTLALLAGLTSQHAVALGVSTFEWTGKWQDSNGGLAVIQSHDGFLDISASDGGSFYRTVCLLDKANSRKASCSGDGINHQNSPSRFMYRSQMQANQDGTIAEEWVTDFYELRTNGASVFKRMVDKPSSLR